MTDNCWLEDALELYDQDVAHKAPRDKLGLLADYTTALRAKYDALCAEIGARRAKYDVLCAEIDALCAERDICNSEISAAFSTLASF